MAAITGWSRLPIDMQEEILGRLSPWDSAKVSTTSKQFYRIFRLKLIKEQNARCDLANSLFGKQRLSGIADVVKRFLSGQPPDSGSGREQGAWWSMAEDGKLHAEDRLWHIFLNYAPLKVGDVHVTLDMLIADMLSINVFVHTGSEIRIRLKGNKPCHFFLSPPGDDDVECVAFVQALLSGELAEQDALHSIVSIRWSNYRDGFTQAGLNSQVAPLKPLASRVITVAY